MTSLPEAVTRTPVPVGHHPDTCRTCRVLPGAPPAGGTLFLSPPAAEPLASLRQHLADAGCRVTEPQPGCWPWPSPRS